jgi:hypothetical protein
MQVDDAVRAAVDAVSREVALVPGAAGDGGLRSSWGRLVDLLALGPPPEQRACPHCGSMGMRAATRCGSCWEKLVPPAEGSPAK